MLNRSKYLILMTGMVMLGLSACRTDENGAETDIALEQALEAAAPDQKGKNYFILPESNQFSRIPQDKKNPINEYKVALGQLLFHETNLPGTPMNSLGKGTYSCASCHHADAGFAAGVAQGIGEGGLAFGIAGETRHPDPAYPMHQIDVQPIKTPSAMNGAYQVVMLWNGQFGATDINTGTDANWTAGTPKFKNFLGFEGLETQAIAGQDVHRLAITPDWVAKFPLYKYLFDLAFGNEPAATRYSNITGGMAIAAYERTLLANQAPWQRWLKGDASAMTEQQKEGALLFFGKAGCGSCHTGPALNSMEFYCLGLNDLQNGNYGAINVNAADVTHKGRGGFTGDDTKLFQFKVPQLYNLKDHNFYGHGSSITSIRNMVAYKNAAVPENKNLPAARMASEFAPLNLTESEIDAITAFLTDALYDPNLKRYVPQQLPTGQCFPNNDAQSRIDRGCD